MSASPDRAAARRLQRALSSSPSPFFSGRTAGLIFFVALFPLSMPSEAHSSVAGKVRRGNKEYHRQNYEAALKEYRQAQLEDPESPQVHYNIGNALHRQEEWPQALAEYGQALSDGESAVAEEAHYNMGNTLYRQGNLEEAMEAYKEALRIDPTDMDAKYNLEFVLHKLQEKEQQQTSQSQDQQSQQQQPEQGEQSQQQEQRQKQQESGQEEPQEQEQKQQEEQKGQEDEEKEEQQAQPEPRQAGEMTQEEAAQLLHALQEQEEKAQEEYRQAQVSTGIKTEWDW